MSYDHLGLIRRLDALYESVVEHPAAWTDDAFADWLAELAFDPPPKDVQRELRRAMRIARKLATFWADPERAMVSDAGDWRTRVDMAAGATAWRPILSIGQAGLDDRPSPELYDEVKARFRQVYSDLWMEGIDYEDWVESRR